MILTKNEKENLNLLSSSYRKDINLIKVSAANTELHELAKSRICYFLKKNKRQFVTEAIFHNGKRADVLDLSTSTAYEVVHSESEKSIELKKQEYPVFISKIDASELLMQEWEDLEKYLN